MPDVQSEIDFAFEVLSASLNEFAQIDTGQNAALVGAFTTVLFGNRQSEVQSLLTGGVGRPTIPVTSQGVPELVDCWSRVLAAVQAYNALDTGLQMVTESSDPQNPEPPHCVDFVAVGGVIRIVYNWKVPLMFEGVTDPVFRLSTEAGVSRQILAMGHAGITVPIVPS